jgi:hypothetical protein
LPAESRDVSLRGMVLSSRASRCAAWAAAILPILRAGDARAQTPSAPAYPSVQPAYPAPAGPPLQTGGLTPPRSAPAPANQSATYQQLDRAEREDAGRGLEIVWLNVESGYEYVSLDALHSDSLVDGQLIEDSGSTLALGVGAGARLIFLTFGARFRMLQQSAWDLWMLNAEVGLHLPYGVIEPSFTFSAGYASVGAFQTHDATGNFDGSKIDISGLNARLGAALDWYVNPLLSLGLKSEVALLLLSRDGATLSATEQAIPGAEVYLTEGSGPGIGGSISVVAGLHF